MHPEPVEYVRRDRWAWVFLLGALAFVALGAWLALRAASDRQIRIVGIGNMIFFGACAAVFARETLRPAQSLRLDAAGIHLRHPRPGEGFSLAWKSIAAVDVRHEEQASLVTLTLLNPQEPVPEWALAKGALPAAREITLSPVRLGTTTERLQEHIERLRRYYGQR